MRTIAERSLAIDSSRSVFCAVRNACRSPTSRRLVDGGERDLAERARCARAGGASAPRPARDRVALGVGLLRLGDLARSPSGDFSRTDCSRCPISMRSVCSASSAAPAARPPRSPSAARLPSPRRRRRAASTGPARRATRARPSSSRSRSLSSSIAASCSRDELRLLLERGRALLALRDLGAAASRAAPRPRCAAPAAATASARCPRAARPARPRSPWPASPRPARPRPARARARARPAACAAAPRARCCSPSRVATASRASPLLARHFGERVVQRLALAAQHRVALRLAPELLLQAASRRARGEVGSAPRRAPLAPGA